MKHWGRSHSLCICVCIFSYCVKTAILLQNLIISIFRPCHVICGLFFGQNLQDDLEKQEKSLQKFGSVTNQLLKECHPPVTETLTNTLKEVNMRYGICWFYTVAHYLYHNLIINNDTIKP